MLGIPIPKGNKYYPLFISGVGEVFAKGQEVNASGSEMVFAAITPMSSQYKSSYNQ